MITTLSNPKDVAVAITDFADPITHMVPLLLTKRSVQQKLGLFPVPGICSNSLGILPTGEENKGPTLVMRIDLDQFWHASISLCSDSFSMLPALEENRAHSLISIDLVRLRHPSTLHKNTSGNMDFS